MARISSRVKGRLFGAMDDLVTGFCSCRIRSPLNAFQLQERWWNVTNSFRERQWEESRRLCANSAIWKFGLFYTTPIRRCADKTQISPPGPIYSVSYPS